ncbi:hypothetical protein SCRM01_290 [Synechococcus phage S-CRM01]|uniref:hypothetical protein n=1 Tax=Synechococcus phage S-CRM01 TaxID=1026955 RepID=UPI000209E31E|nr:hypothetical protein SCRM01_290 [Synechococcus phage S-CRM01]AEC53236.1 hypothetical protein SCRM01_290 [Synechococcus phage S-CRM01]
MTVEEMIDRLGNFGPRLPIMIRTRTKSPSDPWSFSIAYRRKLPQGQPTENVEFGTIHDMTEFYDIGEIEQFLLIQ